MWITRPLFEGFETSPACSSDRAVLRWRWVFSIAGMVLTGDNRSTRGGGGLPQWHLGHQKSLVDWLGMEQRPLQRPATGRASHGSSKFMWIMCGDRVPASQLTHFGSITKISPCVSKCRWLWYSWRNAKRKWQRVASPPSKQYLTPRHPAATINLWTLWTVPVTKPLFKQFFSDPRVSAFYLVFATVLAATLNQTSESGESTANILWRRTVWYCNNYGIYATRRSVYAEQ